MAKNHNITKNKCNASQSVIHLFIMRELPEEIYALEKEKDPTWIANAGNRGNENSFLAVKVQNQESGDFWLVMTAFEIDEICNEFSPYSQIDQETKNKSSIYSDKKYSDKNNGNNSNEASQIYNEHYLELQSRINTRVVKSRMMGRNVLTIYMNYSNYKTSDIWSYVKHREDTYWNSFVFPHLRHSFPDQYKKILNDCLYLINEIVRDYFYADNPVVSNEREFISWITQEDVLAGYSNSYFDSESFIKELTDEKNGKKIIYSGVSRDVEEDDTSRCMLVPFAWTKTIKNKQIRDNVIQKMKSHFIEMSGYEREERFWNGQDFASALRDGSFYIFYISQKGDKTHTGGRTADQVVLNSSPIGYICFDRSVFSSGKITHSQKTAVLDSERRATHFIRLLSFAVIPKYREMGVGASMLLTAIEEMFPDEDSIFCEVSTDNIEAAKLLSSIGFLCVQECNQAKKGDLVAYFNEKNLVGVDDSDGSGGGVGLKDEKKEKSNKDKKPKSYEETKNYTDYDEIRSIYLFKYMRKEESSD